MLSCCVTIQALGPDCQIAGRNIIPTYSRSDFLKRYAKSISRVLNLTQMETIGISEEDVIALWSAAHPDDPIES
jgi:hypothetical protein